MRRGWDVKSLAGRGLQWESTNTWWRAATPPHLDVSVSLSWVCPLLHLVSILPLCFWISHRSFWQRSPHWTPQMGAGARRSHLRHHHLGYCWFPELECLWFRACCLALRDAAHVLSVATALFLSLCLAPACRVSSCHKPLPVASKCMAEGHAARWFCPLFPRTGYSRRGDGVV